jgi:hypothetical protein
VTASVLDALTAVLLAITETMLDHLTAKLPTELARIRFHLLGLNVENPLVKLPRANMVAIQPRCLNSNQQLPA